ncbi:MAG: HD domain-containing protein [Deltaproteobacteria bacterium]|nr:HD domain-containing protein [Deltaproteobacteria bacterium]
MDTISLKTIRHTLEQREARNLSPSATLTRSGRRRIVEKDLVDGYRQDFSVDVDRILHSLAYTRYIDKTQVFYLIRNDHITHRVLHVQLVSKIARTIGRFLGLNEDLIEAIALGHDIGHPPFGHDGEGFLSKICHDNGIGYFTHSVQSVEFLEWVERKGKGWNLCLQTLDGILCHDGEIHNQKLEPSRDKTFDILDKEIEQKRLDKEYILVPMTMEGCVVRMADTISYVGRDIEDAIRLNMIKRDDLPKDAAKRLGRTNGTIVYTLVTDVIQNSFGQPCVAFSMEVSEALRRLKAFNLEHIYLNPKIKKHYHTVGKLFEILFDKYLADVGSQRLNSVIFSNYLENMSEEYRTNRNPAEITRDFISGMTDHYFLQQFPNELKFESFM